MAKKYEIVVETGSDFTRDLREKFNLYPEAIASIIYYPDGSEAHGDIDWTNTNPADFFARVKKEAGKIKTAFGDYAEFCRVVQPILEDGKDVIIVTISSGLSGTYQGFKNYASILLEDYPDRKIEIVDSLKYSSAIGLLALEMAKNRDEKSMSLEDNVNWANKARYSLHESGPMDDLRFLAKNGRISAPKAFFGSLLGMQPLADFNYQGLTQPLGTIKGAKLTNEIAIKYFLELVENADDQVIFISHSCREERANLFKEELLKVCHPRDIIITHLGQLCGPSIGPGLCVIFFFGKEMDENRTYEQEVFARLTGKKA